MTCTRRDALYTIGLAAAATAIPGGCTGTSDTGGNVPAGVATMCGSDLCFKISQNAELQMDGGIVLVSAGSRRIFVQRSGDAFVALSAICTHAGCTVNFNGSTKFNCPCHGSSFAADTGAVLNGPANRPLQSFPTTVAGDDVTISLA